MPKCFSDAVTNKVYQIRNSIRMLDVMNYKVANKNLKITYDVFQKYKKLSKLPGL